MDRRREKIRRERLKRRRKRAFLIITVLMLIGLLFIFIVVNALKSLKPINEPVSKPVNKPVIQKEHALKPPIKTDLKKKITISFAGDFTLGTDTKFPFAGSLPAAFISNGKDYSYFMQNVSKIFKKDDYTLVNLETTFTDATAKAPKSGNVFYNFKGPKEYVNILKMGSIDGVTIANNHIYDYGRQGINDTVNTLKEKNIDICGEGYKILKNIKGVKFGFLGYTGWVDSEELKAKIVKDIKDMKDQGAEVVIPYFHWGVERQYKPNAVQQSLARFCIDNGAAAVIGSHPHVIESMENYKGKLIAYSMSNFCFGGNRNPQDKRTFILQLKMNIENDKFENYSYRVLPAMISSRTDRNDYIPTLATGGNKVNILKQLNGLSPTLKGEIGDKFKVPPT